MLKRYLYSLLFGIPGFFISGIISLLVFGAAMGMLWIYVFGDNHWHPSTDKILSILLVLTFLVLWIGSIILGYIIGKRLEKDPGLNKKHVLISVGLTLVFILFIFLQQLSVGNLGPQSDGMICSDFCTQKGYSASGMPPLNSGDTTCSCYDNSGHEALKVPLDSITPDASK